MSKRNQGFLKTKIKRIHLVAIGGIGMSGIAEVLLTQGFEVSGSDIHDGANVRRLRGLGAKIFIGHSAENVGAADVLVYSSAIHPDNPEFIEAQERGIPIIPRAEMLAELMRMKEGIAIAGTHGKTTTTSLIAWILSEGGVDPTCLVGGRLESFDSNAKLGESAYLVAEADESDGSFLRLTPVLTVITNIDPEHLEHYGSYDNLVDAFVQFANCVPFFGTNVICLDHPKVAEIRERITRRFVTYGLMEEADVSAFDLQPEKLGTRFKVRVQGQTMGEVFVPLPGRHNVQNALAAIACSLDLELPFDTIASAIASFQGIDRRFQVKGMVGGVTVVDDYAHHPEEIRATLRAAKNNFNKRVFALFQPHRYSRVRDLFDAFAASFGDADVLLVTDIYQAGETPIPGITAERLSEAIKGAGHPDVRYFPNMFDAAKIASEETAEGDLFITLGAGNVKQAAPELLDLLSQRSDMKG